MGQTLTKLLRSFKNVVHPPPPFLTPSSRPHPLPPVLTPSSRPHPLPLILTPSLLAGSLKWPSLAELGGQTSSLLAPRRLFSPQGEVIDYSATCDACLCTGDVAWDASSTGSASPTDEPLSLSVFLFLRKKTSQTDSWYVWNEGIVWFEQSEIGGGLSGGLKLIWRRENLNLTCWQFVGSVVQWLSPLILTFQTFMEKDTVWSLRLRGLNVCSMFCWVVYLQLYKYIQLKCWNQKNV